ncbi:MAG TPA: SIS domain-containing protein [Planctomycetota bacterium]|jgi:6-phospho-3-hexuloisomerase|nr:SIS domain-containing protein [Planctomycetota bacterium]
MTDFPDLVRRIAAAAVDSASAVDRRGFDAFLDEVRRAKQVLFYGAGRTGFLARLAVVRWRHLGLRAWFIGEAATPPASPGDLCVVCSGSGETATSLAVGRAARGAGARLAFITEAGRAPKDLRTDHVVEIPVGERHGAAPLGTVFEHALLLLLDAAAVRLAAELGQTERQMRRRHTNIT